MKARLHSFAYALRGCLALFRSGRNAQLQLAAGLIALGLGKPLGYVPWEWVAVLLCIGMVLAMEALNTALEILADEVSLERRPRIGLAKDMAAGGVLIAAAASGLVFLVILLSRFG